MYEMSCYRTEILEFDNPTFKTISTTYVLSMEGSKRRTNYMKQLQAFRPTSKVVILHNKGFIKCKKPDWVKNSADDLFHANLYALEEHFSKHTNPILILEDDAEFLNNFFDNSSEIEEFISRNDVDLYSLGSIPFVSIPINSKHVRMYLGCISHAWIYTLSGAHKTKKIKLSTTHDFEVVKRLKTYIGTKPCAIQKFEKTDNSAVWDFCGIVLKYNQFFGRQLLPIHHTIGFCGGLIVFVVIICIAVVAISHTICNFKSRID
tara:strand:+ start:1763 stop:2548 length:786 start_codon:yes stop_codon:yes gene_type:complete